MNTTIFWIVGGVVTAVIALIIRRWMTANLRRWQPPQDSQIPISHYQGDGLPSLPDIEDDLSVNEPATTGGAEPEEAAGDAVVKDMFASDTDEWESEPPVAMTFGDAGTRDMVEETSEEKMLRMDVAVPPQVEVGRAFDLAVALRQLAAPRLAEEDLTKVASGPVAVTWEESVEQAVVRIQVTAPDCDVDVPEQLVTLTRHQDEPPIYFLLTPRCNGRISIQVKVYQEALLLGNARIKTEAAEEVGHVEMVVTSHPLSLTPNDRRLLRQNLTDAFDLGELHDLIFLLGLDRDNFPQEKDELIIDLIQTCLRHGQLQNLMMMGGEKRPFLSWRLESIPG